MDSSIQQIKTGMHKIDEINNSVTALAYDIRTLTTDLRTVAIVYQQKTGNNESDQSVCRTQV
jgi:hypothetical protein